MNAFNTVNLAGACLLTSTDYAKELGIPESQWIYPLGGAGTSDSSDCKGSLNSLIRYINRSFWLEVLQSGSVQISTRALPFPGRLMQA